MMTSFKNAFQHPVTCKAIVIVTLFAIALIFRLQYITHTTVNVPLRADARSYIVYAYNMLNHGIFSNQLSASPSPDAYLAPGYPAFLAVIMSVTGANLDNTGEQLTNLNSFYEVVLYAQAFVGAITSVITFLIGIYILPTWGAFLAAFLVATNPHLISLGGYVITETIFAFAVSTTLLLYIVSFKKNGYICFAICGLLSAVTYAIKTEFLFMPIILATVSFLAYRKFKVYGLPSISKGLTVFLTVFLLIVTSWLVRNEISVADASQTSSDRALRNFIVGSHHDFFEIWGANSQDPNNPAIGDIQAVQGSWTEFLAMLLERILDNPFHYLKWYLVDKPITLWSWNILVGWGDIYVYPVSSSLYDSSYVAKGIYTAFKKSHAVILFMTFIGCVIMIFSFARTGAVGIMVVGGTIVYFTVIYCIFQSDARYSIPLRPEMYLCAVFFLWNGISAVRDHGKKSPV
jgi:4-amino-4-deoxy-L-arabinose transferase-like glycosyltransferase